MDATGASNRKKVVHYQSISFSDEEEEQSDNHVGATSSGEADANPEGLYTNLRKLDDLCGQVNSPDKTTDEDVHLENTEGVVTGSPITGTDADNEGLGDEGLHNEGPGDEGLHAGDSDYFGAEEAGGNSVMVEVAVYMCKLCGATFKHQNEVESHLLGEHDLGEQTALFRVLKNVRKKKKAWRKEKDGYVHCQYCHHRSRRSINVREHEKEKHANEDIPQKLYECKLCSNRFAVQEIFSHIQTEHESEADSLNFIGNSLTEHYTVSFSTEAKTVLPEESPMMNSEQETIEMSADGFYHCDKCEFLTKELSDFTEHYKDHSLAKSSLPAGRYNHCSQCPYKSKSVRGLKPHVRMKHPEMKNKSDETTCSSCGQKRQKNVVHTCKMSNSGKRRQLLRNSEGHFVCKDCPFTAKQYQSMYIHTKANRHQAERTTSARPVKRKVMAEEVEDEDMMQDTVRVLRQRTPKKNGNPDLPEESASETNDFSDSAQVVPIHTDDITEAAVEEETVAQDAAQDKAEADMEGEWPSGVEGLIDSDTADSGLDDSDQDPEWAPTATPSHLKIKRGPGRPRKDNTGSGSESDSDGEASSRKRRASSDGGGHTDKRRKYNEVPKDPNSEAPKKLPSGTFQCNFCEFESKYHQSTEVHQWRHTGYKPYKCEVCPAAFRSRAQLDKHPCVAVLGDTDKPAKAATDPDGPTSMPELDQTPPSKASNNTDDVPAAGENAEPVNNKAVSPVTDSAQEKSNQSSNPASSEKNIPELSQEKPTVTSPTPIVIAPPLGSHVGNLQVADSDDDLSVPNLDGNGDNPDMSSPQAMQNTLAGPRMTSPVGIPLNIAPITSMGGVDPTRQMSMPMGGMGGFPDGSQYEMGNPPPIMDMAMGPSNEMMHNMPGLMGVGGPGMHGEGVMHPGHYPPGYQQVNVGPAQHHMNPMHHHMGGMMNPGDVPFPAPSMGLMDHLNLMPTNNMMGSAGGYAVPPHQLPPQRHPTMEQTGPNMMPMDNNNFMIDLNTSESQGRFDMNQPLSNTNMDMNMQSVSAGNRTSEGHVLAPPPTSTNSQRLPSSVSPLQQTAVSEPTTPTTVRATPEQTASSIASSPLSLINQASDSESMASVSVIGNTMNVVLASDRDADTGSASDRSEATASTVDISAVLQGNDSDKSDAPASTAETPPISNTESAWSLLAGSGTDTITDTTSKGAVSSAGGSLEPSASDITAAALMAISATAPAGESAQPAGESAQPAASTSASSTSTLVVTAVTGTTPTAVAQPSTAPKPAANDAGKTIGDLFKCILCRVYFEDQQMHRNHMVHHGHVVGTCRICSKMFRTPLLFMNHLHCSANCQGPHVNTPAPQFAATSTRGRGRGVRGSISPSVTPQRLPQGYPQIQPGSVRGGRGRATPQPMTMPMSPMGQPRMASPRGGPLQAMRQMSPTAGRRGRPPLGGNRPTGAYSAALMRQPLQQRQFSAHLQQMGAMRPAAPAVRQPPPRRRTQQTTSDDVIVID